MAAAAQCDRPGTGRLHLRLCGAGWSKDSNGSRSPGIPRSGHGGPGWATARTTFFAGSDVGSASGAGTKGRAPLPRSAGFSVSQAAFGFGILFPAAFTCAAGSYHCPSHRLLSSLQASGDPKKPGSLERVVIPRVARPPTRPPRSQLSNARTKVSLLEPGQGPCPTLQDS